MFKSRSSKSLPLLFWAVSLAACANAATPDTANSNQLTQDLDAIIAPWVSDSAPGVAIAVSLDDEIVYNRGVGRANLESAQPITPESVFQAASISKQFTAFATLLLVSEGQIDLDADIRTYVPEIQKTPRIITVRHLLDHMGGLREGGTLMQMAGWQSEDVRTHAQSIAMIARQRGVNFLAGETVEYSNTGYALLAEIVANVSGQSFQSFMQERVFDPLEMTHSRFRTSRTDIIPGRASGYYPNGEGFEIHRSSSEHIGSTGLYTTTNDLLKWAENFETRTVGDDAVFAMMAERAEAENGEPSTLAKGQELRPYKGLKTWSHGGTDEGFKSFILRVPEEDFEVSIMSNRNDFDTAKMAFALVDACLSKSPNFKNVPPAELIPATASQLSAYAGTYEIFPGVVFDLRAQDGGLTFQMLGAARDNLEPLSQIGKREFSLNSNNSLSLVFAAPVDGESASVDYQIGLNGAVKAKRIKLEAFNSDSVDAEDYRGTYWSEELQTYYVLTAEDGQLTAAHSRLPSFTLTPYQDDTFMANGPLQNLEFFRGQDGDVTGFYASSSLANNVEFTLKERN